MRKFLISLEKSTVIFRPKHTCEIDGKTLLLKKYERVGQVFEYRYEIKNDKNNVMLIAYYITEPEQKTATEDDAPSQQ